jgi:beta-glucanase (GH16 family)
MRSATYSTWLTAAATILVPAHAQTFTSCNPLTQTCPADPALGKSTTIDFTSGQSDQFKAVGTPEYDSEGAKFTVAKSGDAPTITSDWYLMFGHVEVVMKAAPGVGIVSTMVLQSDCLDEIDLEWLGGDNAQVQSNYFGKGQTTAYNRGAFHANPGNHDGFHKYTVDWTADQIVWQIDDKTVRALPAAQAQGQYPQTPMQVKLGIWSAGDPSNPPGTIEWAGGNTDYSAGPYSMIVKSLTATDYSTGTEYTYGDQTGTWKSIKSNGGSISGTGGSGDQASISSAAASAPSITDPATGNPLPFDGTHREASSTVTRPSVWPWVPSASSTLSTSVVQTSIAGLPSGWTVTDSGKVLPPSSASVSEPLSLPNPLSQQQTFC